MACKALPEPYVRRADIPPMNRGDVAAAKWIFRGDESRRPRRVHSVATGRRLRYKTLAAYWQDTSTETLLAGFADGGDRALVNIASDEYFRREDIPWRRVAATPRPGRGYSVETGRPDATAATRTFDRSYRAPQVRGRHRLRRGESGRRPSRQNRVPPGRQEGADRTRLRRDHLGKTKPTPPRARAGSFEDGSRRRRGRELDRPRRSVRARLLRCLSVGIAGPPQARPRPRRALHHAPRRRQRRRAQRLRPRGLLVLRFGVQGRRRGRSNVPRRRRVWR